MNYQERSRDIGRGGPESESPHLRNNSGFRELLCHEPEI